MSQLTKRLYDTFGPDRMIWGMLGNTPADYQKQAARFEELLAVRAGERTSEDSRRQCAAVFFS